MAGVRARVPALRRRGRRPARPRLRRRLGITDERLRFWLLGDWGPVVRDPIDLGRLTFLIAAVYLAIIGDTNSIRLLLTFGIVLVARWLELPRPSDLALLVGMGFQAYGNAFGIFDAWPSYDTVVHFVLPLATAPAVYILLIRLKIVPDLPASGPHHNLGIVLVTFAVGTTIGAIYEVYEYLAVNGLGAKLHIGYGDTIKDLCDDALASLCGGLGLVVWRSRGWGTTRRVPGLHHSPPPRVSGAEPVGSGAAGPG